MSVTDAGECQESRGNRCRFQWKMSRRRFMEESRNYNKIGRTSVSLLCGFSEALSPLRPPPPPCLLPWYRPRRGRRSRLYSSYRLQESQHNSLSPPNHSCLRLQISARLLQQGLRYRTHIGRLFSVIACSFMKPRGVEGCPIQIGSPGGTTVV